MIEEKGIGGKRKLLIERHSEFLNILREEGRNVFSAGTEERNGICYFRVILNK